MAILQVNQSDYEEKVLKSPKPVLVDFYADWCGPCKLAEPVLDELSNTHANVAFVKVNVDENQELSGKYSVLSIPTTIMFKAGEEVGRQIGFAGKQGYEELLKKAG